MTAVLEELTRVVAALPAEQARQVLDFARTLAPDAEPAVDDSYDWTDEDMRDATRAAMVRFDLEHPENEGYDDLVPR